MNAAGTPPQGASGVGLFVHRNRSFLIIWAGQAWSMAMSSVTGFALGVHVFEQSQSAFNFGLMLAAYVVPGLLIGPLAGRIADTCPGRTVLLFESWTLLILHGLLAMVLGFGTLEVWQLVLFNSAVSLCVALYLPAWMILSASLVQAGDRPRALGLAQLSWSMAQILGPMLGGLLLLTFGLRNIVLVNLFSLAIEVATLYLAGISGSRPKPVTQAGTNNVGGTRFAALLLELRRHPGFCGLLLYGCAERCVLGVVVAVTPPLILSNHSATVLGGLQSTCALGALFCSLALTARRMPGGGLRLSFWLGMMMGMAVCLLGLSVRLPWLYGWGFLAMFLVPLLNVQAQLFWESRMPDHFQGRMVALRTMLGQAAFSLSVLVSTALADQFGAAMQGPVGLLASLVRGIGLVTGGAYGLVLILAGILMGVIACSALCMTSNYRRFMGSKQRDKTQPIGKVRRI